MRRYTTRAAPTPPTGTSSARKLIKRFPLTVRDSWLQWKRRHELAQAERDVLRCVDLDPIVPQSKFRVKSMDIEVGGGNMMNELSVSASSEPAERHIVLLHGYGASKGYFCYNFRPLASLPKVELHALDWLGYGRSTRARLPSLPKSRIERVHVAEEFFCGSLERWRQKRGIENFSIVAHSLGAYLACSYANLYPHCVDRIALVSPASVNRTTEAIPREELGLSAQASPSPRFVVPGWFRWGWERFWSPFEPVRWSGPLGPKLVSMWTSLRFRTLPQAERDALHRYAYAMFNAQGSGEYLLNCFLAPGGVGRWPLVDRIDEFPAESVSTLWMYGQNDWMDPQGGWEAVKKLRSRGGKAELTIIPNSGHHLYLDNVAEFNRAICAFMA